jgi:hypothetical protein
MGAVTVRDQALGAPDFELEIELDSAQVTAAELIRGRVIAEIARAGGTVPRPIVVAVSELEESLNGRRDDGQTLDPETETQRALGAFRAGRFVLIIDGRQIEHADEIFTLTPDTQVNFVRLVPLRGG